MEETRFSLGKEGGGGGGGGHWMNISNLTSERTQGLDHEALEKFCLGSSISESIPQLGLLTHDFPMATQFIPGSSSADLSGPFEDFARGHCWYDRGFGLLQEKKLRRMMSNRESARRSRLRKKKQIEDLQFQVNHLRNNKTLMSEKLLALFESNQQAMEENAQLKEKVASLQIVVSSSFAPIRSNDMGEAAVDVGLGSSSTKSEGNGTLSQ
ncbi:hypothetical protein MLD38_021792 [Melastoma candidum]|uniref:Uncharacterized protein n=2 Tax=Melastoma candidum TaxID=119954 RepID=A0ACB9QK47_9MYRT|nr:hypothetical protein MLD38_021792 [Melastoma candidum]